MADMSIFYLLSGEPLQYFYSHNPDPNSSMRLRKTVEIEQKNNRKQGANVSAFIYEMRRSPKRSL